MAKLTQLRQARLLDYVIHQIGNEERRSSAYICSSLHAQRHSRPRETTLQCSLLDPVVMRRHFTSSDICLADGPSVAQHPPELFDEAQQIHAQPSDGM